jgi:shikimate dehydrogenase
MSIFNCQKAGGVIYFVQSYTTTWVLCITVTLSGAKGLSITFDAMNKSAVKDWQVGPQTKVVGLFGYPVKHSASPAMHNAAFRACGLDYVYLAFEVNPECLGDALSGLVPLGIRGVNLTIPHKEGALRFVNQLSEEAAGIGAVNTVVVDSNELKGYNTDMRGFLKSLSEEAGFTSRGQKALMIGAGGAARAVSFGLALSGLSELIVVNKPFDMAEELVSVLGKKFPELRAKALPFDSGSVTEEISSSSLLINATPLGMNGEIPISDAGCLHSGLIVYDLVYIPLSTPLLREAEKRGAKAVGGLSMLVYQGAASFELWTGVKPPVSVMKRAAEESVRKRWR